MRILFCTDSIAETGVARAAHAFADRARSAVHDVLDAAENAAWQVSGANGRRHD